MLEVAGLQAAYGTHPVLFGVDLTVQPGSVLCLLGTNGAGKTTLLRAISGLHRPSAGRVTYAGRDLARVDAAGRVALGIVQVPAGRAVFPTMTVLDNLLVGCHPFAWDRSLVRARVERVVSLFPALDGRLSQLAGTLSGGEQQMLALGKALVLAPSVLLIDELTLGLAPVAVQALLSVVGQLRAEGTTMVIVEQSVNLALSIADEAAVMEKGKIRLRGPAASLLGRDDLVGAMFLRR